MLQESPVRLRHWVVESHTDKQLITSLGMVNFHKTLFTSKETGRSEYLLERILGLKRNERMTEDAEVRMLKEAVQTSYRRGGAETSLTAEVGKQTVKNKVHGLKFPKNEEKAEREAPKSRRHRLVNPYYFCSVSHVLSSRMSSRPMGWSIKGAEQMARLRAYYLNGGDMLKLVRYQEKEMPKVIGAEYEVLSSKQLLLSEANRHGELGKYSESITHSLSLQNKKMVYFNAHIWGL